MPNEVYEFLNSVAEELWDHMGKTVRVLRWRSDANCPHNALESKKFFWSIDGGNWVQMSLEYKLDVTTSTIPSISDRLQNDIVEIVKQSNDEPIGHILFREAWYGKDQNPRSSLIIGIAAAEAGFKEFVSKLVPGTSWLIENLPSPPLDKMLKKYFPTLEPKLRIDGKVIIPSHIINRIKKGIETRNDVAHVGAAAPEYTELKKILVSIKDLLWLLDYYAGHDWALDYLSQETQEKLELSS